MSTERIDVEALRGHTLDGLEVISGDWDECEANEVNYRIRTQGEAILSKRNCMLLEAAPQLLAEVIELRARGNNEIIAELIEAASDCYRDCVSGQQLDRLGRALAAVRGDA